MPIKRTVYDEIDKTGRTSPKPDPDFARRSRKAVELFTNESVARNADVYRPCHGTPLPLTRKDLRGHESSHPSW